MPEPRPIPSVGDAPTVTSAAASVGDAATVTGPGRPADRPTVAAPVAAPPGFAVERELGRGGMGVVYLARQHGLNRPVALKLVLTGGSPDGKTLIRFLAEAEAVAAVRHPNVVEVYQYGEHAGSPYLAMEYCPGGSLADGLKDGAREPALAAETLAAVAEGVAAAHAAGVVHRDLKPHNVLVAEDGSPKVTDFGLAKRAGGADLTRTSAVMGTPAYMAPEQAKGDTKFVGPQADVWALGVMLYELLSGDRPFAGEDTWQVLAAVQRADVVPVRKRAPGVPRDLALICEKCLSAEPHDRYPTAAELAADLHRFLAGEPVSVRPPGRLERAWKWVRRNKAVTAAVVGITGALALGLAATRFEGAKTTKALARAVVAEREASERLKNETAAKEEATGLLASATLNLAQADWLKGNYRLARERLDGISDRHRHWEWHYLATRFEPSPVTFEESFPERGLQARALAFTPDGQHLLTYCAGVARVRDMGSLAVVSEVKLGVEPREVYAALFSHGGARLVTVEGAGLKAPPVATVWDPRTGRRVYATTKDQWVQGVVFSRDGARLAVRIGSWSNSHPWGVVLVNPDTGAEYARTPPTKDACHYAAFDPAGRRLYTVTGPGKVHSRDAVTGGDAAEVDTGGRAADGFAFTRDGTRLLVTTKAPPQRGPTLVLDAHTGRRTGEVAVPAGALPSAGHYTQDGEALDPQRFAADGVMAAALGRWGQFEGSNPVGGVLGPDGRVLAVESAHGIKLFDVGSGAVLKEFRVGAAQLGRGGRFSPDGRLFAAFVFDGRPRVAVWPVQPLPSPGRSLRPSTGNPRVAAFAADATVLAAAPGGCRILDVRTGRQLLALDPRETVHTVAVSPDGGTLITGGPAPVAGLWDARSGKLLHRLAGHSVNVPHVAFSPDGRFVATVEFGSKLRVWDPATGNLVQTLELPEVNPGSSVEFSPDGRLLAVGGTSSTVAVRVVQTGEVVHDLKVRNTNSRAAFSPDGRTLAVYSTDAILLFDLTTGALLRELVGHSGIVAGVAFSPDSRRLMSAGADGQLRVWDPVRGQLLLESDLGGEVSVFGVAADWGRVSYVTEGKLQAGPRGAPATTAQLHTERLPVRWQPGPSGGSWVPQPADEGRAEIIPVRPADPAWHIFQAGVAEADQDWLAVRFHLRAVAKLRPDDVEVRRRLGVAEDRLRPREIAPPPRAVEFGK